MTVANQSMAKLHKFIDYLADHLNKGWVTRIIVALLAIASIAIILWSLNARLGLIYGAKSLLNQEQKIGHDIEMLKVKVQALQPEQLNDALAIAESNIMQGQGLLLKWLNSQIKEAKKRNLKLSYKIDKLEKASAKFPAYERLPIHLSLMPTEGTDPKMAYQDLILLARDIVSSPWRIDLDETSLTGNGEKIMSLNMTITVWMSRKKQGIKPTTAEVSMR